MNRIGNILLAAAVLLGPVSARAQGVVLFRNVGAGLNAPVTNAVTGQLVAGSGYLVQLYGEAAGYFDGGLATNSFVLPGSTGTFQVRAWSAGFATYEAAYSAGLVDPNVLVGKSSVFQNSTGISSAATLTGLTGSSIAPVPEPTTLSCFVVSAALVFWRCRG